jgi:hypothetical protein
MAQKRSFLALSLVLTLTSCASPPTRVDASASPRDTGQPALSSQVLGPDQKTLSESVKEADCVLSTGAIHLWCKWISRYY